MVKTTYKSLGLPCTVDVPGTVEEYNTLANRTDGSNAALDDAIDNVVYRSVLNNFRWKVVEAIDNDPTIPVKMNRKTVKDKDGKDVEVIDEAEGKYFARVCATLGLADEAAVVAKFGALAAKVSAGLKFDPAARAKTEKEPTISKAVQKIVDDIFSKGDTAVQKTAKRLTKELGRPVEPTRESITGAVVSWEKAEMERQRAARDAARNALLGQSA